MNSTLTIALLSDTCFSMPAALSATVDTDFAFDDLGLPTISGKTLHGLLRDTWLSCGMAMGYADADGWALLGRPLSHIAEGLVRIGDAHVDESVQSWAEWALNRPSPLTLSRIEVAEAFAAVRILTREDRGTGTPEQETLRMVRVVPAGTVLVAPVQFAAQLTSTQYELLQRLAQLTRHAGLDRNRGLGHLRMVLSEPTRTAVSIPASHPAGNAVTGTTTFLPLTVKLTAPCLISSLAVEPNSSVTMGYVPGTALRGAVAAALERMQISATLFTEIIVSGKVRFLNAYPDIQGKRCLPAPLTWQRDKEPTKKDNEANPTDVLTTLFDLEEQELNEESATTQRQPVQSRFYATLSSTSYQAAVVRRTYRTHQSRVRSTGITRSGGDDTVFVYESLDANQIFQGAIALPAGRPDIRQVLETALQGEIWLGRSARSGYGGAPTLALKAETSFEPGGTVAALGADSLFCIRLTSDAVIRNPMTGQHDPSCLVDSLTKRFAGKADVVMWEGIAAACIQTGRTGGYHRLWRTHLPALPCAVAGSVVLMRANDNGLSRDEVIALQAAPLGERSAEGCGCFVIDKIRQGTLPLTETTKNSRSTRPNAAAPEALMEAQRRVYRAQIRMLVARQALEVAQTASRLPNVSLIQRLRIPLRSAGWQNTFAQWLTTADSNASLAPQERQRALELKLKKPAIEALTRAKIGNSAMADYLRRATADSWRPTLQAGADAVRQRWELTAVTQSAQIWDEELRASGVFFLDMLLSLLAKRARTLNSGSETNTTEENQ